MFRSLFPFRRLLATTFLVVFTNVFVGQCWCATVNPAQQGQSAPAATMAHRAMDAPPAKPAHPGCHGHGVAQVDDHHGDGHHPAKKAPRRHDCCKDKSASLLSSLTAPVEKQLVSPAPALLPEAVAFHFRPLPGQWDRTHAVVLVLREHLPPKIPDIRIYIQSLTV